MFRNGDVTILALQRDEIPALTPENRETVEVALPRSFEIYDLRARHPLGRREKLELALDPIEPALLALAEKALPQPSILGPRSVHRGDKAEFLICSDAPAARGVIHLDVLDPDGNSAAAYSGNVLLVGGTTTKLLPLAVSDKTGLWKLRAVDALSGATTVTDFEVEP